MNEIDALYEIYDLLCNAVAEAPKKVKKSGSTVLPENDLRYLESLTHAFKGTKASIAMCESEDDEGGSAFDDGGGSYHNSMNSRRSYSRYGNSRNGSYNSRRSRRSYARNGGYSGHDFVMSLKDALEAAPDDQARQQIEQLIQDMGQR